MEIHPTWCFPSSGRVRSWGYRYKIAVTSNWLVDLRPKKCRNSCVDLSPIVIKHHPRKEMWVSNYSNDNSSWSNMEIPKLTLRLMFAYQNVGGFSSKAHLHLHLRWPLHRHLCHGFDIRWDGYEILGIFTLLVGGWPTPLKNMKVSWDDDIPNIWNNKSHVPNHQSDHIRDLPKGIYGNLMIYDSYWNFDFKKMLIIMGIQ